MSASNHTPGPWHIGSTNEDRNFVYGPDDDVVAIAEDPGNFLSDAEEEKDNANARLIAAAPELLEALTKLVEKLDVGHEDGFAAAAQAICEARVLLTRISP